MTKNLLKSGASVIHFIHHQHTFPLGFDEILLVQPLDNSSEWWEPKEEKKET